MQYDDYKSCKKGNWVLLIEPRLEVMPLIFFQSNEKEKGKPSTYDYDRHVEKTEQSS